jgi:hypothetical protein
MSRQKIEQRLQQLGFSALEQGCSMKTRYARCASIASAGQPSRSHQKQWDHVASAAGSRLSAVSLGHSVARQTSCWPDSSGDQGLPVCSSI